MSPGRNAEAARLLAPFLAGLTLLVVLPALATVALAFVHYDALGAPRWAGLANFTALAHDPVFRAALSNSALVALVAVPVRLALALGLALLLQPPRPEAPVLRTIVFLPAAVPDVAWALVWLWILNPLFGPMAWLLPALGVRADAWLTDPQWARHVIVLTLAFGIGEMMLVLIAARREVPAEVYELCAVEGASPFTTFRRVTLPLLWPALLFLACRDAALTLQTTFVPGVVITNGGPNFATTFLPHTIHQSGFEYLRFGYAAAQTLAMLALTAALMALQVGALRRWARHGA